MGVFPCGICNKIFPYEKRLKDHLKDHHGFNKASLVNNKIAEWKGSIIPSTQVPEEKKECCFCKKGFSSKHLAEHKRRCAQRDEAANAPANRGAHGTLGGEGNASGGIQAAKTDTEPQEAMLNTKEGHKAHFHQFLIERGTALKLIQKYMELLDQWMDLFGDEHALGSAMIETFPRFIDQLPTSRKKTEAFSLYGQFTCYAASFESDRPQGSIEFKLMDGKAVPVEERPYITKPRVLPSLQEGDGQLRGRGCRHRKEHD